jgi:hypothetical protein
MPNGTCSRYALLIWYIAGRCRLGWVKLGLAIRLAEGLRLNGEPSCTLPAWQQEEHRRVFWSVYVMDRFVSCCRIRAPSILDVDCTVFLPISERSKYAGGLARSPSLAVLNNLPDMSMCTSLENFALLVLVASILGRVVRYNLQQKSTKGCPPWDFRSEFAKISTMLLSFETLLTIRDENFESLVRSSFSARGVFERPRVGHFIWSRGLYHLTCCLLHHPFFLHRHLQQNQQGFPRSFARSSIVQCKEHAEKLTHILQVVSDTDCCARGSFLGYFAVVAGSVHRLFEHSTDLNTKTRSQHLLQVCLDFLQQGPVVWENFPLMVSADFFAIVLCVIASETLV